MGFSKKHTEPETYISQQGSRPTTHNRNRRSSASPGKVVFGHREEVSVPVLLRQLWYRFRRSWIALRFQAHRLTFGIFQRNALLKTGFLTLAGYFLLFNNDVLGPDATPGAENRIIQSVGTSFEWSDSDKKSRDKPVGKKIKNEAAPVSKNDLSSGDASDYVDRFQKIARGEMEKYGIPASISLAQGLIESRAGSSKLAVNNNNHFGIKCFSRHCRKGHCTNFTDDTHKDFFRKFPSPWESWRAHSQLLSSGRYTKLRKNGRDYRKWAYGLKSIGYATDRTYAEKLIGIIERYELYKYDR